MRGGMGTDSEQSASRREEEGEVAERLNTEEKLEERSREGHWIVMGSWKWRQQN